MGHDHEWQLTCGKRGFNCPWRGLGGDLLRLYSGYSQILDQLSHREHRVVISFMTVQTARAAQAAQLAQLPTFSDLWPAPFAPTTEICSLGMLASCHAAMYKGCH